MAIETNHSLSVDCVIFGYDSEGLKVLLVEQRTPPQQPKLDRLKLPGSMILENETLPEAARRVLKERTGLEEVYLKQIDIFSNPERVVGDELKWIAEYHNVPTNRVVTVGYYALLSITQQRLRHTKRKGAIWQKYENAKGLVMDHDDILIKAMEMLREDFEHSPIAFELLPKRFTIRELQDLYSAIKGVEIDNRNFRKKILGSGILTPTGEREKSVAHKPAEYFTFNSSEYKKIVRRGLRLLGI